MVIVKISLDLVHGNARSLNKLTSQGQAFLIEKHIKGKGKCTV